MIATTDLATLAKEINTLHKSRIRTNLVTAAEIGGKLEDAKKACKRGTFVDWADANCEVKHAMRDRYRKIYRDTKAKPELLDHMLKEEMGVEGAYEYLVGLKQKSKAKKSAKKNAVALDKQLVHYRDQIKELSAKLQAELPAQEWKDYLFELDAKKMSEYFSGEARMPLPERYKKAITQTQATEEFRPAAN